MGIGDNELTEEDKKAAIARMRMRSAHKKQEIENERSWDAVKNKFACTECGYIGERKVYTKGSLGLEIIAWCFFIVPGIFYSLWRHASRYKGCPECRHDSMIPIKSPKGKKLYEESKI